MKKVWPRDEQKAIAMPNSRNRHSTRMKPKVDAGRATADGNGSERDWVMAGISPRRPHPGVRVLAVLAVPLQLVAHRRQPLLEFTTLLDVRWLAMFARREVMPEYAGVMPTYQELPKEARLPYFIIT